MPIAVGDWVTERATRVLINPNPWSPSYERIKQMIKGPRTGRVIEIFEKCAAKGRKTVYASVLWDGAIHPSVHGAMRLVKLDKENPLP